MKRQIFYADANSKIGEVKVYKCPHCMDGEEITRLRARIEKLEIVLELAKTHVKEGGMVNAQRLAHAIISADCEEAARSGE